MRLKKGAAKKKKQKDGGVLSKKLTKDLDLLKRHVDMLLAVAEKEPIGIIRLAEAVGLPQHKVRYSLRLLEKDGLIEATNAGARTTKKTEKFLRELGNDLGSMKDTVEDIQRTLGNVEL